MLQSPARDLSKSRPLCQVRWNADHHKCYRGEKGVRQAGPREQWAHLSDTPTGQKERPFHERGAQSPTHPAEKLFQEGEAGWCLGRTPARGKTVLTEVNKRMRRRDVLCEEEGPLHVCKSGTKTPGEVDTPTGAPPTSPGRPGARGIPSPHTPRKGPRRTTPRRSPPLPPPSPPPARLGRPGPSEAPGQPASLRRAPGGEARAPILRGPAQAGRGLSPPPQPASRVHPAGRREATSRAETPPPEGAVLTGPRGGERDAQGSPVLCT